MRDIFANKAGHGVGGVFGDGVGVEPVFGRRAGAAGMTSQNPTAYDVRLMVSGHCPGVTACREASAREGLSEVMGRAADVGQWIGWSMALYHYLSGQLCDIIIIRHLRHHYL